MGHIFIMNTDATTPLVFIYGWCSNPNDFNQQIYFLKAQFEILAPDYTSLLLEDNLNENALMKKNLRYA